MKLPAILLLVVLFACNNTPPDFTTTIPFWLGQHRDSVRMKIGLPDIENINYHGDTTESYWDEGYTVEYVNNRVIGIEAATFVKEKFQGKLFGLELSDGLSECEDRFGKWVGEKFEVTHTVYTWYYQGNTIEAEVLEESGNWHGGGSYENGTLRTLEVIKGEVELENGVRK
jgi:hypothetical protein